jgi:hypothetical protein
MSDGVLWVPMEASHIPGVDAVADSVHPGLPERSEVFMERLCLYPSGCMVLVSGGSVVGYGVGHPWWFGSPPELDSFLGGIPGSADMMYMHDIAVLPGYRGGRSRHYVGSMRDLALGMGLGLMGLVSVYGTSALWGRMGFVPSVGVDLGSYGDAVYMVAQTGDVVV